MDPITIATIASLAAQGGSALFNAFKKKPKNPANGAMEYLNKIPGTIKPLFDPYIQQGQEAYGKLQPQYEEMFSNPAAFLENIGKDYQQSPGYNFRRDEMLKSAGNTAAAGGMRGSLSDIQNEGRLTEMLAGDDFQQWLQNVLGIKGAGLQGEQGFYNNGFNASTNLAGDLSNVMGTQAGLSFQGQAQQNASSQDQSNALANALASMGGTISSWGQNKMNQGNQGNQGTMKVGNQWMMPTSPQTDYRPGLHL